MLNNKHRDQPNKNVIQENVKGSLDTCRDEEEYEKVFAKPNIQHSLNFSAKQDLF